MLKQSSIKYKLTIIIIKQSCCVLTDISSWASAWYLSADYDDTTRKWNCHLKQSYGKFSKTLLQ